MRRVLRQILRRGRGGINKMNIPVTASKIIDRAILLEEGGAIVIPCSSYEEMERLRIRLYKLKKELQKGYKDTAVSLDIKRKVTSDRWTLFITKDTALEGVFIVEGGEAKAFEDEVKPPEEAKILKEPKEPEVLKEPEADFDDIAEEIEKAQGLTKEEDNKETSKIDTSEGE